jgi:NSS family neurotransmitter:Na+ symporter
MPKRLSYVYLTLVVAAFMVGLGNIWKFPSMIIEYGVGGLIVYLASVVVLTGMLAAALETTKKKGYEVMEYFSREYGKPAFALLFLVFDTFLIGYYSIVGGWTLTSIISPGVPHNVVWNIGMAFLFIFILLIILIAGKEKTTDFMVASFVLFTIVTFALIWYLRQSVGCAALSETMRNILTWRGLDLKVALDMASQAAYSLGVGMGFYLLIGVIFPHKRSGTNVVVGGAVLDTLLALAGLVLIATLITAEPSTKINSTTLLFEDLPSLIRERLGPSALYVFNVSLFLAAITSMLPIGEVIGRITAELLGTHRGYGIMVSLTIAAAIGIIVSTLTWLGFDPIGILDGAVSTFILFGGIIEAYAAARGKEYIPGWLRAWAWIGIITVTVLGLYSFLSWSSPISPVLLVVVALSALALNGRLEKALERRRKRFPGKYYRR